MRQFAHYLLLPIVVSLEEDQLAGSDYLASARSTLRALWNGSVCTEFDFFLLGKHDLWLVLVFDVCRVLWLGIKAIQGTREFTDVWNVVSERSGAFVGVCVCFCLAIWMEHASIYGCAHTIQYAYMQRKYQKLTPIRNENVEVRDFEAPHITDLCSVNSFQNVPYTYANKIDKQIYL